MPEEGPEFLGDVRGERREKDGHRLEDGTLAALQVGKLIEGDHECADGGVEGEVLDVLLFLADELVEGLEFGRSCSLLGNGEFLSFEEEPPEALEEAVDSVDSLRVPRLALLKRAEEHLVETESVGTVFIADPVRIDDVEHGLAHLLDGPSTDIFTILEDKLGIGELRPPGLESLDVQAVVADETDVHVDFSGLVAVLQADGDELVGAYDPVDEA